MKPTIHQELLAASQVLKDFTTVENIESIERAAQIMIDCIKNGGKIIACGNGGSMSDAMHFCSELTGRYRKDRPPIPALAISDPGHLSCVANDFDYEYVFGRFIEAHGKEGDVLLALSTSMQSANVIRAMEVCVHKNMHIVTITKAGVEIPGWPMLGVVPVAIEIPTDQTDRCQEMTIKIIHILVHLIEKGLGYA